MFSGESEHIIMNIVNDGDSAVGITEEVLEHADKVISTLELDRKGALHTRLIFEETVGMLRNMAGEYEADMWFEKDEESLSLKLTAKTRMDYEKKNELLSIATDKKNKNVKGFMDKVSDIIQNGILNYEYVLNLTQEYGGGCVNYGSLGMYCSTDALPQSGVMWSLSSYRDSLSDEAEEEDGAKEAWDELERSIVANIASDVLVGVKGNKFEMTIKCKL
ncbi:MAG: hypothetical protein K6G84_05235 [Lachnospiraceae bacterium]|nr:hypothetical protein [Lachnospiraceae bacterium]